MKAAWLLLLTMNAGWAADFPVDTVIGIPGAPGADSIPVRISALDTDLIFFTTLGTASCPGYFSGDIKNAKKTAASDLPERNRNYSLWSAVATCGTGPNSYSALNTYYEYELSYRGKTLYLEFTKFIGPSSFPSGTFPEIAFQINIDTASHIHPASIPIRRAIAESGRGKTRSRVFDAKGRRMKGLGKLP
jgi:hypothetical protein